MAHHFIVLPTGSAGSQFINHALLNDPDLHRDLDQIFDLELVQPDDPRVSKATVEASLSTRTTPLTFRAVVSRNGIDFEEPRKLSSPLDSMARAQAFLPQARVAVMDAVGTSLGAERKPTDQIWLVNPAALIHRASGPNEDSELTSRIVAELGNGRPLNVDPDFADLLFDGRRIADVSERTSLLIEVSVPTDDPSGAGTITATHVDTGIMRNTTLRAFPSRAELVLSAIQRLVEELRDAVVAHSQADSSQKNDGEVLDTPSSPESAHITDRSDIAHTPQEAGQERSRPERSGETGAVGAAIDAAERVQIAQMLENQSGGQLHTFFGAHGYGQTYDGLSKGWGKAKRIATVLDAADRNGERDQLLVAARSHFSTPELHSSDSVAIADRSNEAVSSRPLRETLSLEPNREPSNQQNAMFQARIETLLGVANRFIDDGYFDENPNLRDLVERDRNFLRAEAFETDEPFALGDAVGAIVARLERNLLSVADVPDTVSPLLDDLVEATSADSPDKLPDILDRLIDTARLDDSEWLASQNEFDAFAAEIHDIAQYGARRWLMKVSDWWHTGEAETMRHHTGWGATVGAPGGAAIGLLVAAVTAATLGAAATVGGIVGAVVGLSLAWFFGRYRNSDESSED